MRKYIPLIVLVLVSLWWFLDSEKSETSHSAADLNTKEQSADDVYKQVDSVSTNKGSSKQAASNLKRNQDAEQFEVVQIAVEKNFIKETNLTVGKMVDVVVRGKDPSRPNVTNVARAQVTVYEEILIDEESGKVNLTVLAPLRVWTRVKALSETSGAVVEVVPTPVQPSDSIDSSSSSQSEEGSEDSNSSEAKSASSEVPAHYFDIFDPETNGTRRLVLKDGRWVPLD